MDRAATRGAIMIPVKNIYYMLAYAFRALRAEDYRRLASEKFPAGADLCASLLAMAVSRQLKRGLMREYVERVAELATPRGQILVTASLPLLAQEKKALICAIDDYSEDCYLNRVIKTTMQELMRTELGLSRRHELRRLLELFRNVTPIPVGTIDWSYRVKRDNKSYRYILSLCYLALRELLPTKMSGRLPLLDVSEENLPRLYEKFILEFYRRHYPKLQASASQIPWAVEGENASRLPTMQTDIMLASAERVLIIDAKYYAGNMQAYYGAAKHISSNLYQIFTYVKNKEVAENGARVVAGMLLYAQTDSEVQPDDSYVIAGSRISLKTLNLGADFKAIASALDEIVQEYFGVG